jgi:hypothetical protein
MTLDPKKLVNVDEIEALIAVECCGARHRIAVGCDGSLRFFDHDPREITVMNDLNLKAGNEPAHECARIQAVWAGNDRYSGRLPGVLSKLKREADDRGAKRRAEARVRDSLRDETVAERFARRTKAAVHEVLRACRYRVSDYQHEYSVETKGSGKPEVLCDTSRVWDGGNFNRATGRYGKTMTTSHTTFIVPLRWYANVYKKGLGTLHGNLVLDVLDERRDGRLTLLVAKQSRGFRVAPTGAIFCPTTGKLEWI